MDTNIEFDVGSPYEIPVFQQLQENLTFSASTASCEYLSQGNGSYVRVAPVQGPVKYISYIMYGMVLLFGTFGNIIVLYVVGYRNKKRNSVDLYILALGCADFLASIIVSVLMVNHMLTNFSGWLYGDTMYYVLPGVLQATICASGWFLILISLDRYRVISKPLAQKLHWSKAFLNVALVWATSIGVVLPDILTVHGCLSIASSNEPPFTSFIKATAWVIYSPIAPCIIIFPINFLSARALKTNTLRHENNRAMQLRNKQNAKVVRMFIIIVMAFLLLTMPYSICYVYSNYLLFYDSSNPNLNVFSSAIYILLIPATANCCVNPLIYAKLHNEINGYLKNIIHQTRQACCRCCGLRLNVDSSQSTVCSANNHDNSQSQT